MNPFSRLFAASAPAETSLRPALNRRSGSPGLPQVAGFEDDLPPAAPASEGQPDAVPMSPARERVTERVVERVVERVQSERVVEAVEASKPGETEPERPQPVVPAVLELRAESARAVPSPVGAAREPVRPGVEPRTEEPGQSAPVKQEAVAPASPAPLQRESAVREEPAPPVRSASSEREEEPAPARLQRDQPVVPAPAAPVVPAPVQTRVVEERQPVPVAAAEPPVQAQPKEIRTEVRVEGEQVPVVVSPEPVRPASEPSRPPVVPSVQPAAEVPRPQAQRVAREPVSIRIGRVEIVARSPKPQASRPRPAGRPARAHAIEPRLPLGTGRW